MWSPVSTRSDDLSPSCTSTTFQSYDLLVLHFATTMAVLTVMHRFCGFSPIYCIPVVVHEFLSLCTLSNLAPRLGLLLLWQTGLNLDDKALWPLHLLHFLWALCYLAWMIYQYPVCQEAFQVATYQYYTCTNCRWVHWWHTHFKVLLDSWGITILGLARTLLFKEIYKYVFYL